MKNLTVEDILKVTKGELIIGNEKLECENFSRDTRNIQKGDTYVAIKGENFDGNIFWKDAFKSGADCVIVQDIEFSNEELKEFDNKTIIKVADTMQALYEIASYKRKINNIPVVAITGSVGKTSTKDMIYAVVSTQYKTLKTLGNYNNHIGLPLTILRHQNEDVMVLEMGMNHLGEIHHLTHIAKPDIACITNVGTAHIGELGSRENILKAKMEIVDGLSKDGTLIINDNNDLLHTVACDYCDVVRVGYNDDCQLKAHHLQLLLEESYFDLDYQGKTYHVHVPVSGEHFVVNALIAIAVGLSLDIPIEKCIAGIDRFELTKNRMDIIELNQGMKVIDGTYNANLDSMKSSLDVLAQYPERKIAVLADMLELGEYEQAFHEEVGDYVAQKHIDVLLTVGQASRHIMLKAKEKGIEAYHFENNQQLKQKLEQMIQKNDVILVKGSHGMHLHEIVEYLKEIYKK